MGQSESECIAAVETVTKGIVKAGVNLTESMAKHGVDSLIAAELCSWFLKALKTYMRNLLGSHTSIDELAKEIPDQTFGDRGA